MLDIKPYHHPRQGARRQNPKWCSHCLSAGGFRPFDEANSISEVPEGLQHG